MSITVTLKSCYGTHKIGINKTRSTYDGVYCNSLYVSSYKDFSGNQVHSMLIYMGLEATKPNSAKMITGEQFRCVSYLYMDGRWGWDFTRLADKGYSISCPNPEPINDQLGELNRIIRFLES